MNRARHLAALLALTLTLAACTDPVDVGDPSAALAIVEGASATVAGNDAAAIVVLRHDQSVAAPFDWAFEGPARVRATPASGRLAPGERVTIDLNVDRGGLTEETTLQAAIRSGDRALPVELTVGAESAIAPCDPDPSVRYAHVRAAPLEVAAAAFAAAGVTPTAVLVGLAGGSARMPLDALAPTSATATAFAGGLRLASDDPLALARVLAREENVRWVELDGPILTLPASSDPSYEAGDQWWLDAFGYASGRTASPGANAPVIVAVIDSGIDVDHEDLDGALANGFSFIGYGAGEAGGSIGDENGHGTHVAGLVAARVDNGIGIAGIAAHAPVRLQVVRVFDARGSTTLSDVSAGIRWAAGLRPSPTDVATPNNPTPAHVINLSLGGALPSAALHEAVIDARCAGALVVAAAGNGILDVGRRDGVIYPARYPETIAVGSVDENGIRSRFSDYGAGLLDVMAPGGIAVPDRGACTGGKGLLSTYRDGGYACLKGTSMATPLASGMAALLISREPTRFATGDVLGVERLEAALRRAAALRPGSDEAEYGRGILCLDAVLGTSGCSTNLR